MAREQYTLLRRDRPGHVSRGDWDNGDEQHRRHALSAKVLAGQPDSMVCVYMRQKLDDGRAVLRSREPVGSDLAAKTAVEVAVEGGHVDRGDRGELEAMYVV